MGQLISTTPVGNLALVIPKRYQAQLTALLPSSWLRFDLQDLPPELALAILSYLNPTDLYLASGVWWDLASSETLWRGLCRNYWPFCSAYENWHQKPDFSFRILFLRLDEARLTFNSDAFEGMRYLHENKLLKNDVQHIALYLHVTPGLNPDQKRRYLEANLEILDALISLKNFCGKFLPNALRDLCAELLNPMDISQNFIPHLLERFSVQFVRCNGNLGFRPDMVYVLCISLLMLSKDFASPQIKNKMSKREFIRNTRQAVPSANIDLLGQLYDNVYVEGDIGTWVTVKSSTSVSPPIQRRVTDVRPTPRLYRIIAS
nr:F box only protein 8 [Hymenolepis microstoma]